jgi:uncharacterized membrane-anchored protein
MTRRTMVMLPVLLAVQLALVAVGVLPQLSARASGDEIMLRVEPVDPIDPFRGAYVALGYPDLRHDDADSFDGGMGSMEDGESGTVFVSLRQEGDIWVAEDWSRSRPTEGTYLRCSDRSWQVRCGIESWFLPQDDAREMEDAVTSGDVLAKVEVDRWGNAALVEVSVP